MALLVVESGKLFVFGAEVTHVEAEGKSLVVFQLPPETAQESARQLARNLETVKDVLGLPCTFLVALKPLEISALSEDEMNDSGWVRKVE